MKSMSFQAIHIEDPAFEWKVPVKQYPVTHCRICGRVISAYNPNKRCFAHLHIARFLTRR